MIKSIHDNRLGRAWKHACSSRIMFKRGAFFDEDGNEIQKKNAQSPAGHIVEMYVLKTKTCKWDRKLAYYHLNYTKGVDIVADTIDVAMHFGYVQNPAQGTFTGRDANKGACTHPCRWKYAVVEEKRPGEYLPVYENERGTYIFNSKDLCMIEHIPDLIDAGIDSYKIEGRMKTALYVATVARTYRKAIDDYLESPEKYQENMNWYLEQISNCTYRQFTTGFFYGKPTEETQIYDNNTYEKGYTYLGIVGPMNDSGMYRIEQRNKFSVGEEIEVMKPNGDNIVVTVKALTDEEGQAMESCPHPKQVFYVDLGIKLDEFDILRRKEEDGEIILE